LLLCQLAQRRSHLRGRENGRRNLVQERLKDMVIATIDDENFDIGTPERSSRSDPAEAASQDDDTRCPHVSIRAAAISSSRTQLQQAEQHAISFCRQCIH
jgi:hypothetical protein